MSKLIAFAALAGALASSAAAPQELVTYKAAVVALADDPEVRASFEEALVTRARERRYDVITSYDLAPDVRDLDDDDFLDVLEENDIRTILMLRPATVGPGSSLESVRNEVSPSREQGLERLRDLVLTNVDAVRPAIRQHLGLPPLE